MTDQTLTTGAGHPSENSSWDADTSAPLRSPRLAEVPTDGFPAGDWQSWDLARPAIERVQRALVMSDTAAIALVSLCVAVWLRVGMHGQLLPGPGSAVFAVSLAVPVWLGALALARAYESRFLFAGSSEIHRVGIAGAGVGLVLSCIGWLVAPEAGEIVIPGFLAAVMLTIAGRWVIRMRVQRANRAGVTRNRVVVVGGEGAEDSDALIARLQRNKYHGWTVVGSAGLPAAGVPPIDGHGLGREDIEDLRRLRSVVNAAREYRADIVVFAPSASAQLGNVAQLQRALYADGRVLAFAPPLVEAIGPRVSVDSVCGLPVVRLDSPELRGPRRIVKDVADRFAAGLALALLSPLLLVMAVVVRLDSRGPAIFRQTRVGREGQLFTVWKFRTMHTDAEQRLAQIQAQNEGAGPLFKLRRDPRITRVGVLLRKTSMDELPQFVNVLRGQMSIVGPRPALPREVDVYDEVTRRRLLVRPGITGLWQISGRSDLTWEETSRLDVRYVENWSLGFDMSIIIRTVDAVLLGRGAY